MPYIETDTVYDDLERCSRCLLPDSFPGIGFDDEGVCNYCCDQSPFTELGEDALTDMLNRYRGRGGEYDCIAPISGGRDSAYVLHQIVTRYDMRVLALTVDSGFITEEAYSGARLKAGIRR